MIPRAGCAVRSRSASHAKWQASRHPRPMAIAEITTVPVEAKSLFRPEVVRPRMAGFALPDSAREGRAQLGRWAGKLASGEVDRYKEQEILPDFLRDVFRGLLGYVGPVDGADRYTFAREKHNPVDGKIADAVLGDFRPGRGRYVAAVEGKGPKDPLERPFAGRKISAVDQGY